MFIQSRSFWTVSRISLYSIVRPRVGSTMLNYYSNRLKSTSSHSEGRPRLVFLGSGFDLTVVSPRNYFTFTPLLPKVLSGMVNSNTASEPMINFMKNNFKGNSKFLQATCVDLDTKSNTLTCVPVDHESPRFTIPYDYLVIAVGATSNTFGIRGVEKYAYFLKEVEHAELALQKIVDNFRLASMPFVTDEEKSRLLHFVVVGGGPTGVESTGELSVLMDTYFRKSYPDLLPFVKVSIVEGGQRLLASMSESSSEYVSKVFSKNNVNVYFGKVVCEVKQDSVVLKETSTGNTEEIECGLVLWASGLKETDLVSTLKKKWNLPENSRALFVDEYLKVHGTDNVFCLGDCCKIVPKKLSDNVDHVISIVGNPSLDSLISSRKKLEKEFPQVRESKWKYKSDKFKNAVSEILSKHGESRESFVEILRHIDSTYIPPFPTAQNAKQEAVYLSKLFNNGSVDTKTYTGKAFSEEWKGTLASLGGLKVIVNTKLMDINGGFIPFVMWNCVYLLMFSSCKMRASFLFDLLMSFCTSRHLLYKKYKN